MTNYKTINDVPEDLRWLAENEHEWRPVDCYGENALIRRVSTKSGPMVMYCHPASIAAERDQCYTRQQHQSARDLLSGKPGWSEVLEAMQDATHLAQSGAGAWLALKNATGRTNINEYWWEADEQIMVCRGKALGDWRKTLERKPIPEPEYDPDDVAFKADASRSSIDCWCERGELPPAGTECEVKPVQGSGWTKGRVVHITDKGVAIYEDMFGDYSGSSAPADFRPLQSKKERWVEAASEIYCDAAQRADDGVAAIYDALQSGELAVPGGEG